MKRKTTKDEVKRQVDSILNHLKLMLGADRAATEARLNALQQHDQNN